MIKLSTLIIIGAAFLGMVKTTSVNAQTYTPPLKVDPLNIILKETSGLQWVNIDNSLWTFNDSGGDPAIYRVDTAVINTTNPINIVLQTVGLQGATNADWEDIAFDGTYMYIGDFGNNANGARNDLKIYKFPFAAIPTDYSNNATVTIPSSQIEIINFSYADQTDFTPSSNNNTKYDCEAMLVDNGKIHLFTKNWIDYTTTHYIINSLLPGTYSLSPLETYNMGYLITAADKAPNTSTIILLGYKKPADFGAHFITLLTAYANGKYFNGTVKQISLPLPVGGNSLQSMGQAEGITFRTDTYGYISNEYFSISIFTANQKLRFFDMTDYLPAVVLPLKLLSFIAVNTNNTVKLAWDFDTPVSQLQLQKSVGNTNNFITIKTFDTSKTDFYYDPTNTTATYYRLVWSNGDGGLLYSNIVTAKSDASGSINNLHLKQNGELTFTLNGNASNYSIQLTDVNGKTIIKFQEKTYFPGINKINTSANLMANGIVFITMQNNAGAFAKKLLIE